MEGNKNEREIGRRPARSPRRAARGGGRHLARRQRVAGGGRARPRPGPRPPDRDARARQRGRGRHPRLLATDVRRPLPALHRRRPAPVDAPGPARDRALLGGDRARHARPAGRLDGRGGARTLLRTRRPVIARAGVDPGAGDGRGPPGRPDPSGRGRRHAGRRDAAGDVRAGSEHPRVARAA